MAKDHYVARTYLKHFANPIKNGMLLAYKKKSGKNFTCWPDDVCNAWDDDFIDGYFQDPGLLGLYRKIFEPHWNLTVKNVLDKKISINDKFVIAGYLSNLMVCTPKSISLGVKGYNLYRTNYQIRKMQSEKANLDEVQLKALEMFEKKEMVLEVDLNYIKANFVKNLLNYAIENYQVKWDILFNKTEFKFYTSDNPAAIEEKGYLKPIKRYLPITPEVCISFEHSINKLPKIYSSTEITEILSNPPLQGFQFKEVDSQTVKHINKQIIKCADEIVFVPDELDNTSDLIRKYSKFIMDVDFEEIPIEGENAYYAGIRYRVKETSE